MHEEDYEDLPSVDDLAVAARAAAGAPDPVGPVLRQALGEEVEEEDELLEPHADALVTSNIDSPMEVCDSHETKSWLPAMQLWLGLGHTHYCHAVGKFCASSLH